jgi:hypothetical protein
MTFAAAGVAPLVPPDDCCDWEQLDARIAAVARKAIAKRPRDARIIKGILLCIVFFAIPNKGTLTGLAALEQPFLSTP